MVIQNTGKCQGEEKYAYACNNQAPVCRWYHFDGYWNIITLNIIILNALKLLSVFDE